MKFTSKTLYIAWGLVRDRGLSWSNAIRLAIRASRLRAAAKVATVLVTFRKLCGEITTRRVTLPEYTATTTSRRPKPSPYLDLYDTERNGSGGWIRVHAAQIVEYCV